MRWRGAFVIGGWTGVADGDDRRVVTSQAFVDGVVAALESGTDGGACARGAQPRQGRAKRLPCERALVAPQILQNSIGPMVKVR